MMAAKRGNVDSVQLNATVWEAAGSPSEPRKRVLLRNLEKVPELFVLRKQRNIGAHYRVSRGELWTTGDRPDLKPRRGTDLADGAEDVLV